MRAYLVPHVPFMIPEIGGEEISQYIQEILDTFRIIREDIFVNPPEAILICSPHYEGKVFEIGMAEEYRGSFSNFNRPDVVDIRKGHLELSMFLQNKAEDIGFVAGRDIEQVSNIDYGSIVPLKLLDPAANIPIVPISISMGSKKEHFLWGKNLLTYVSEYSDNVIFIASTELSQQFKQEVRAYPDSSEDDIKYLQLILSGDIDKIESFKPSYFTSVENNLLPTCILSGFGHALENHEILLYTGFVGCGCAFLEFTNN